jgi:hypothetical protein
MSITITDDSGQILGTAARVLDFTNEPGGRDPEVPQLIWPIQIKGWRMRVGHTWSISDDSARIWVNPSQDCYPGQRQADLRCPSCVTKSQFVFDDLLNETYALMQHRPGCPWLNKLIAAYQENLNAAGPGRSQPRPPPIGKVSSGSIQRCWSGR